MPEDTTRSLDFSLVIVTYQRPHRLLKSLEHLKPHMPLLREIIVVDNDHSTDLKHRLENKYGGRIKVIHPDTNLGAVGRSVGILASTGQIVITLDDDILLVDPEQLQYLENLFLSNNRIGCVNFKILYSETKTLNVTDWCHPRDLDIFSELPFDSTYISEGACAFDGNLVRRLNAYPLDLFIGQEGVELAARIINSGHSIFYTPSICVEHSVAHEGRASGRLFYYNTRNIYWIVLRCYPLILSIRTLAREWSMLFLLSLFRGRFKYFLRGCLHGILHTPSLLRQRNPISYSAAYRIHQLNRLKPSLFKRALLVRKSKTLN